MQRHNKQEGIALLVTLLLTGVLLSIGASLLNTTLKQYQFSGLALASETAFQAANSGMECILYHDFLNAGASPFDVNGDGSTVPEEGSVSCMGQTSSDVELSNNGTVMSGEEQLFRFSFGASPDTVCSEVSVYKFHDDSDDVPVIVNGVNMQPSDDCPAGGICTVVQARGYNFSCAQVVSGTNPRVVEREYTQVY